MKPKSVLWQFKLISCSSMYECSQHNRLNQVTLLNMRKLCSLITLKDLCESKKERIGKGCVFVAGPLSPLINHAFHQLAAGFHIQTSDVFQDEGCFWT